MTNPVDRDALSDRFAKAGQAAQAQTEAEQLKALGLPPGVHIENADEPMKLSDPNKVTTGPWIQYNGIATVRYMDEEAWKNVGVESTKFVQWDYMNQKRVPLSTFNDDEITYLLRRDGRFSLVEAN